MPPHDFGPGEWIGSIAAGNDLPAWQILWKDPGNAGLRRRRDPNLLLPGDRLSIPAPGAAKEVGETALSIRVATGRKHKLVWYPKDKFRIRIVRVKEYLDLFGPIPYELRVGEHVDSGNITEEGQTIEVILERTVASGTLDLGGHVFTFEIGGLGPLETFAGIQGRVNNLGWDAGPVDDVDGPKTQRGVKAFQAHTQIKVDGVVGGVTRRTMKKAYGC